MARAKKKKKIQVEVGKYITEKKRKRYMTYTRQLEITHFQLLFGKNV